MKTQIVVLPLARGEGTVQCRCIPTIQGAKRAARNVEGERIVCLPCGGYDVFLAGAPLPKGARVVATWAKLAWVVP